MFKLFRIEHLGLKIILIYNMMDVSENTPVQTCYVVGVCIFVFSLTRVCDSLPGGHV